MTNIELREIDGNAITCELMSKDDSYIILGIGLMSISQPSKVYLYESDGKYMLAIKKSVYADYKEYPYNSLKDACYAVHSFLFGTPLKSIPKDRYKPIQKYYQQNKKSIVKITKSTVRSLR